MKELGFTDIYHLSEGINGWVAEGLTTEVCEPCLNALLSETP
jgi:rhodanese-related sulfurtransferase